MSDINDVCSKKSDKIKKYSHIISYVASDFG
jgi:hypothetical protein